MEGCCGIMESVLIFISMRALIKAGATSQKVSHKNGNAIAKFILNFKRHLEFDAYADDSESVFLSNRFLKSRPEVIP